MAQKFDIFLSKRTSIIYNGNLTFDPKTYSLVRRRSYSNPKQKN